MSISRSLRSQPRRLGLGLGRPARPGPPQPPLYHRCSNDPTKTGHFYLARNRTFLFGVDTAVSIGSTSSQSALPSSGKNHSGVIRGRMGVLLGSFRGRSPNPAAEVRNCLGKAVHRFIYIAVGPPNQVDILGVRPLLLVEQSTPAESVSQKGVHPNHLVQSSGLNPPPFRRWMFGSAGRAACRWCSTMASADDFRMLSYCVR